MRALLIGCLCLVLNIAEATELKTSKAIYEKLPLERWFDGTVAAVNQATISAETHGRVQNIFFDVGDIVPAGAVVLTLVSNEQREALSQAEAAVAEEEANLGAATQDFNRINELFAKNAVSKSEKDRAQAAYNVFKAKVASAEAALKTAKEQLSYTEVRAPYGGIVSARHVNVGEAVHPGIALMSGFDLKLMRVHVDLPESVFQQVQKLKKVRLVYNKGLTVIPDKLILYPFADPKTGTVRARLELPEPPYPIYPGEFIKVAFTIGDIQRLLIPANSVVYRSEVSGVYVIENGHPHFRQIRVGNRFGDKIEVLAGLKENEIVADDPVAASIMIHEKPTEPAHG